MAEFVEVMKQYVRLCKSHNAGCITCPVSITNNKECLMCGEIQKKSPEKFEHIVMKWASEHPEPLYPTWEQWQMKMFPGFISSVCPTFMMKVKDCDDITCDECRSKRIPAEIAEKLGIKPGKEWE